MQNKLLKFKKYQPLTHHKKVSRFRSITQHPFVVPIATVAGLLLLTFAAWHLFASSDVPTPNAYVVIISHDHQKETIPSHQQTVKQLLDKLNIRINEGDVVEPAASTKIQQDDFRINIYRAVPVEVVDGTQKTFAFSAATTPRSIAQQSGVQTYAEDAIKTEAVTNFLQDYSLGTQVVIDPSVPINLNLYGTPTTLRTHAKTVGELVAEKNIKLAKGDQLVPSADTPLTTNASVLIVRNGTKVENVTQAIPAPVQVIQDPTLAFGTSAVRQQGSAGTQVTTYQDNLQNNVVVGRTVIQQVVTVAPVTQIVVQGTSLSGIKGDMALAGIAPADYSAADYIISHESGWCPTKAQGQYGSCPVYAGSVPSTGGYGLCQSTPGSKMASAGADWATNPITQLKWCSGYATSRYGGWQAAYQHWLANHNW